MGRRDRQDVADGVAAAFGPGADLLGGVIRADRDRGGREAVAAPSVTDEPADRPAAARPQPTPLTEADDRPRGSPAGPADALSADNPADLSDAPAARPPADRPAGPPRRRPADPLLADRRAEAEQLRRTPTTTVTLRVPRGLNDWLDEYVHRSWPDKVLKQDLVAEALRLLFARRGRAGGPVLPTDLLADGGEP